MPYKQTTASEMDKTKEVHIVILKTAGGWLPMSTWWNDLHAEYPGDGFWDERIKYPYSFESLTMANKDSDEWAQDEELPVILRPV